MKIQFTMLLLLLVESSFAIEVAIGIQNGVGQSFELNRQEGVGSLWGYRGNIYSDLTIHKNIIFQPSISYSQKGSTIKLYETNINPSSLNTIDTIGFLRIASRSQVISVIAGIKPFIDINKLRLSGFAGPRIDYILQRIIDNTPLGGGITDVTSVTTKWIPGINLDLGFDYKFHSFLFGLVFNNEFDLNNTKAEFGEIFRSYKYSIMLNIGYNLSKK